MVYKVKVNGGKELEIVFSGNEFTIDGHHGSWDKIVVGKNRFHILRNNRSYNCEVISADREKKLFVIKVNGKIFNVGVKDRFDELLHKLGMENSSSRKVNNIKAPMPGLVLKVMVKEDQEIDEGDSVLILEAMKMENVIKSPGKGTVKTIKVKIRDAVEKGQVLIELK